MVERRGAVRTIGPAAAAGSSRHTLAPLVMHASSVRLSSKRLYIADLAERLEAMESGKTAMSALAYRLYARRMNQAVAAYPAALLAAQLGRSWPSVVHALEQQRFAVDDAVVRGRDRRVVAIARALLGRLTLAR
jgi:uncharacterized lipoprotein